MSAPIDLTAELLKRTPIPPPEEGADKDSRGKVVIVGGSPAVPGAMLLCGMAAFRGGAGKVRLAVPQSIVPSLGVAFPEAAVMGFAETSAGDPAAAACEQVCAHTEGADAILIGPGMMNETGAQNLAIDLLERLHGPLFVIDAMALTGLWNAQDILKRHDGRIVLTPHAGEMAKLSGHSKERVIAEPLPIAQEAAERLQCTVVLKGAVTHIAMPDGTTFRHSAGVIGLATAGSGDVMAGLLAGLAARGASPLSASLWSVFIHARAGEVLTQRIGALGFLSRELLIEIPALLEKFDG